MKKKRKRCLARLLAITIAIVAAGCGNTQAGEGSYAGSSILGITDSPTSAPMDGLGGTDGTSGMDGMDAGKDTSTDAGTMAGTGTDGQAAGRYIETQLPTPEGFAGMGNIRRLLDGSLLLVDAGNAKKSISTDNGQTWETQAIDGLESIRMKETAEITSVAMQEDGGIFISYIAYAETTELKTTPERYLYYPTKAAGGGMRKFELGIEDYKTNLIETAFSADGRLFAITATMNVYEIDLEKESAKRLFSLEHAKGADLCTNGDFLMAADGETVYFYDLKSGEISDEDEALNAYLAKQSKKKFGIVMCAAKNGTDRKTLCLGGGNGIAGHVIGGSVMELFVDGALSNLGDPSKEPEEIIQDADGSFLVFYTDGELDAYVYDKDAPAVPQKQLAIYGLYDNETVRQAISLFRKKHPEVFVRFEVGLSSENGMTREDAVKNLNTELLAGTGPDMILLDGMPLGSYQEKGMLLDISGIATDLERSQDYFTGILNGYRSEGGTYALPFRYEVPLLAGERAVLSRISDLKTLADEAEKLAGRQTAQETVLGTYSPQEVLEKLCLTSANAWVAQNGEVDADALQEFLTQAARIYQADQKNLDAKGLEAHREYTGHIERAYKGDKRAAGKVLLSIARVVAQLQKTQVLTAGYLSSMDDFRMVTSVKRELDGQEPYGYRIWNGQDGGLFVPAGTIGISVNSANRELAGEFLQVLFGNDVQGKDFGDGFPVNASAYEAFTTDPMPDKIWGLGVDDRDGNEVRLDTPWPDKKELKQLKKIIQSLHTPAVFDESLQKEVITIGAQALLGEKKVGQSVEEIVQKITLHLIE